MPLTRAERKDRMPHGRQRIVAATQGVSPAYITAVMNGTVRPKSAAAKRKLRRLQAALARELRLPVREVFPPDDLVAQTNQEAPPLAEAS